MAKAKAKVSQNRLKAENQHTHKSWQQNGAWSMHVCVCVAMAAAR